MTVLNHPPSHCQLSPTLTDGRRARLVCTLSTPRRAWYRSMRRRTSERDLGACDAKGGKVCVRVSKCGGSDGHGHPLEMRSRSARHRSRFPTPTGSPPRGQRQKYFRINLHTRVSPPVRQGWWCCALSCGTVVKEGTLTVPRLGNVCTPRRPRILQRSRLQPNKQASVTAQCTP